MEGGDFGLPLSSIEEGCWRGTSYAVLGVEFAQPNSVRRRVRLPQILSHIVRRSGDHHSDKEVLIP